MRKDFPLSIVYIFATLAMFFWSIAFIWVQQSLEAGFRPLTIIFLRLLVASIVLTVVTKLFRIKEKIAQEDRKWIFILAFCEPFCYFLGETFGMLFVTATTASVIVSTIPLITPIFAWFLIHEKVNIYEIIGLIISFLGVLVLVVEDLNIGGKLIGFVLMFIAVISGTGYGITLKKLTDNYTALTITKFQTIIGMLLFKPLFLIFDLKQYFSEPINLYSLKHIILLGLFPSSISFTFLAIVVRKIGVVRANVFSYLIPVFTAILAYYILGEKFSESKIIAILIVIFGLIISQLHKFEFSRRYKQFQSKRLEGSIKK
ncbi:MAG: DMT family transporter [Candidatus Cloacimonetes bacterium]|nr:DMT family transporter [Candidatus Cloacimonadota bacterium]